MFNRDCNPGILFLLLRRPATFVPQRSSQNPLFSVLVKQYNYILYYVNDFDFEKKKIFNIKFLNLLIRENKQQFAMISI